MSLTFLGVHAFISILFLLLYGVNHPLKPILRGLPELVNVVIVSLLAFTVYAIFAYFTVLFKRTIDDIDTGIDHAALLLITILGISFLAIFGLSFVKNLPSLWVIYAAINPLFGNFFLTSIETNGFAMMWIVSSVVPSLAMVFGMSLRLKHLERKSS